MFFKVQEIKQKTKKKKQVMTTTSLTVVLTMLPSGLLHQLLLQQLRNSFDIHLQLNYKRTTKPRDIVSPTTVYIFLNKTTASIF